LIDCLSSATYLVEHKFKAHNSQQSRDNITISTAVTLAFRLPQKGQFTIFGIKHSRRWDPFKVFKYYRLVEISCPLKGADPWTPCALISHADVDDKECSVSRIGIIVDAGFSFRNTIHEDSTRYNEAYTVP